VTWQWLVGDGWWVGVVEGELTRVRCMDGWLRVDRAMSTVEHNYVIIDGDGEGSDHQRL